MPKWIHDRAKHLREKNPEMPEAQSFAIATQQAYAAGKAPKKGFGTSEGKKTALKKYDDGRAAYKKTADPKSSTKTAGIDLVTLLGFSGELQKAAGFTPTALTDVRKAVSKTRPGKITKVPKPDAPEASPDHLSGIKTNPPPPITAGGF